jgi:hypothetical protein
MFKNYSRKRLLEETLKFQKIMLASKYCAGKRKQTVFVAIKR